MRQIYKRPAARTVGVGAATRKEWQRQRSRQPLSSRQAVTCNGRQVNHVGRRHKRSAATTARHMHLSSHRAAPQRNKQDAKITVRRERAIRGRREPTAHAPGGCATGRSARASSAPPQPGCAPAGAEPLAPQANGASGAFEPRSRGTSVRVSRWLSTPRGPNMQHSATEWPVGTALRRPSRSTALC